MGRLLHEYQSENGTVKVYEENDGSIRIDSYYGDIRDRENHDRYSYNTTTGQVKGHGFNHSDKFDNKQGKSK